jgi:tRNA threonylcarbamoyladenosine biosynthesis protein TsaB
MACILNIETSTTVCSVALVNGQELIYNKVETDNPSHAALVGVFTSEALKEMKSKGLKLDAVAVSCGPGSYTGLRIGVSFAKGLCFGEDIPLIAIPTLRVMAEGAKAALAEEGIQSPDALLCPMIDARRMEVYAALYKQDGTEVRGAAADILEDENPYAEYLEKGEVFFFGNGMDKCKTRVANGTILFIDGDPGFCGTEVIGGTARFIDGINPLAQYMAPLAQAAYERGEFENVAYYEPFYLKEFQATVAKNKVLRGR